MAKIKDYNLLRCMGDSLGLNREFLSAYEVAIPNNNGEGQIDSSANGESIIFLYHQNKFAGLLKREVFGE